MAFNQAFDMRQWYIVAKELQLASLQLCKECRSAHAVHPRVDSDMPTNLLAPVDVSDASPEGNVSSWVPRLRARRVKWELPSVHLLSNPSNGFAEVEELYFGDDFNNSLEGLVWPRRLRRIEFGWSSRFNEPIDEVVWPASLQQLSFGYAFNQPIDEIAW